jgi:coat protein Gp5
MLRQVKNNLQFVKNIGGEDLAQRFTQSPKVGETFSVRKPTRFVGRDGETYSAEDYTERVVTMTVQQTAGVDITLTQRELMFQLDDIAERIVKPAAETLANKIDRAAMALAYKKVANFVGVPGTVPTALKTYNQARAKMAWEGVPADSDHFQLVTPDMSVEIADSIKGLFHNSGQINKALDKGMISQAYGANWLECQNLITHTVGSLGASTPLMNGATSTGASQLVTDGWAAAATLKAGDIIAVGSVNAVNPWTRASIGARRQMVVTADATADGSGNMTIPVAINGDVLRSSGALQNIDALPQDGAAIYVYDTAAASFANVTAKNTPTALRFHKEAFLFGTFAQPEPGGVEFVKTITDKSTGISIRFIRDWDTANNRQMNRFDVVWAFGTAFPEFAARIQS